MSIVDYSRLNQWQETELNSRRITPRVGHEPCFGNVKSIHFGKTVNCFRHEFGRRMTYAIPLFPFGNVLDAKVCGKINYANACFNELRRLCHRYSVWRGKKHDIAFFQRTRGRFGKINVNAPAQAWKHISDGRARLF